MKKVNLKVAENSANLVEERKSVQVLQNEEVNAMSIVEEGDEELQCEIRTQKGDFQYLKNGVLTGEKVLILNVPKDCLQNAVDMCCDFQDHSDEILSGDFSELYKWYLEDKEEDDEKLLYEIRTQKGDFQYFRNGILTGEKALILDVPDDYVFQTVEMCCYFFNQGRDFLYCFYDDLAQCYTESKTENLVV